MAFIFSLIGLGIGYVLTNSIQFGMCKVDELVTEASCINSFERVGDPLFYGMAALAIVFLVLLFRPSAVGAWKKFAKWYIPIVTLIFIFYPNPGSGDFFSPYPEQIFQWLSTLYVVVSLIIIFVAKFCRPDPLKVIK